MQKYLLKKTPIPKIPINEKPITPINEKPITTPINEKPITTPINETTISITEEEIQYINSLSTKEKKAYEIAKQHLKTSFTLSKSQGYVIWTKTNTK